MANQDAVPPLGVAHTPYQIRAHGEIGRNHLLESVWDRLVFIMIRNNRDSHDTYSGI